MIPVEEKDESRSFRSEGREGPAAGVFRPEWYEAVFSRRSRRTFAVSEPEEARLRRLEVICRTFLPFKEARAVFVRRSPDLVFKGILGAYGKIRNAPYYVAFIGDERSGNVQEAVGYTGEGVILEATALSLATCWVGGFFKPAAVRDHIELEENHRILAVSPVGTAFSSSYSWQERSMSAFVRSRSRKPLGRLLRTSLTRPWMAPAIEAARQAPSAVNRQPWRFSCQEESIVISVDGGAAKGRISKRLDCGIAMLHLELGAGWAGVRGRWDLLEAPDVARFTKVASNP